MNYNVDTNAIQRQTLLKKYNTARSNLLLIAVFTVVNVLLLVTQSNTYFLFSAAIPYIITDLAMFLCGKYPEEFYTGEFAGMEFMGEGLITVAVIVSLIIIALYLLAFFLSGKQKGGWLIFAITFFSIDTAVMIVNYGIDLTLIIDYVFHAWAIVSFAIGINAHLKLKNLPEEAPVSFNAGAVESSEGGVSSVSNSFVLRPADYSVKEKVLAEVEHLGKKIVYRRVKKTNELVIDGNVYDEYIATMEFPHTLKAVVDGHYITAGYDGLRSFIMVDGQVLVKKVRLI